MSRDSAVGIATGYRLDDQGVGVRVPVRARIFHFSMSGAHLTYYPMGIKGSYPGVKRLEREADHSPPTGAEVKKKKTWSIHPLPIRLHGVVLN
jgi:hypothetical protein